MSRQVVDQKTLWAIPQTAEALDKMGKAILEVLALGLHQQGLVQEEIILMMDSVVSAQVQLDIWEGAVVVVRSAAGEEEEVEEEQPT